MKKHLLILATLIPMMATAPVLADASKPDGGMISVTGTGTINKAPDMASVSAGVEFRSETAQKALADNNAKMQALFGELEKAGIASEDIQTSSFNIRPEMVYPKPTDGGTPKPPQIVGYVVHNQVSVDIHDLGNVGSVLTALVGAGANDMSGLSFDIANKDALMQDARKAAIADARSKAELYATELGTSVERLVSLSEGGGYSAPQPVMMRAAKMEAMASSVPVAEGSMAISITITTSWELED